MIDFKKLSDRVRDNSALSGRTHAISSLAVYLLIMALATEWVYEMLDSRSIFIVLASIFIVAGSSKMPDLDNTRSSAMSALGPIGQGLSIVFRSLSNMIYAITKTKYDKDTSNPHRGFFHTLVSSVMWFFLVLGTASIKTKFTMGGTVYTVGEMFAVLWLFLTTQVALAGIFSKRFKKNKDKGLIGGIINIMISLVVSIVLLRLGRTETASYQWVAFSFAIGYLLHIMGDTLTKAGAPILFPLRIKGKRWYDIRFMKIESGGEFEKIILVPFFCLLAAASIIKIVVF